MRKSGSCACSVQMTHVTDGIDRGHDPQKRRDRGEHHAERIGAESEVDPGRISTGGSSTVPPASTVGAMETTIANMATARDRRYRVAEFLTLVEKEDGECRQSGDGDGEQRPGRYHRVQAAILS